MTHVKVSCSICRTFLFGLDTDNPDNAWDDLSIPESQLAETHLLRHAMGNNIPTAQLLKFDKEESKEPTTFD